MSARRQPSTTSLSKYMRAMSPDASNRPSDFCNSFWGVGDGGVDVLFARMRGASKTIDEFRAFLKERSAIEEDYAKRLAKLAQLTLGREEIGELRNSLDTLKSETEKQAGFHLELAQQIRKDMEVAAAHFAARQTHHKKTHQAVIEKSFKTKQTQETYVNRAREKYEADCLRINSFTAQSALAQGKELEKLHLKLERAQQTVQANERDFANFSRSFQDTVSKWEMDWKEFCDSCQDMEEDRLDFMKDHMWIYANAVSTVCVSDDESCERMRLALEQMELKEDMEFFVHNYGTGNLIPDPPAFVNYTSPDAVSSSSSRPSTRPAHFARVSQRTSRPMTAPPPQEEEPVTNTAGVGAGGGSRRGTEIGADPGLSRTQTQSRASARSSIPHTNGNTSSNASGSSQQHQPLQRQPTAGGSQQASGSYRPSQDLNADPIDPTARTMIKIGENMYPVDPYKDPQLQGSSGRAGAPSIPQTNRTAPVGKVGDEGDPLAQTMESLRSAASGSVRKNSYRQPAPTAAPGTSRKGTMESSAGPSSASMLASASSAVQGSSSHLQNRDYRNSAEVVVGAYPSTSRPASPNPPKANFFPSGQKPLSPSDSGIPVEGIVADYQQSLPGEVKSTSSRRNSFNAPQRTPSAQNSVQGQNLARPVSREGHVGIGAHGRSSPQPASRSSSPAVRQPSNAPPPIHNRNSFISVPSGSQAVPSGSNSSFGRSGSVSVQRATSPNGVGIALDPNGRVAVDEMANMYNRQPQYNTPPQRQPSYNAGDSGMTHAPSQQTAYNVSVPPPANYQPQQPLQQPGYGVHHPPPQTQYTPQQPGQYHATPSQTGYQRPMQPYGGANGAAASSVQRTQSISATAYGYPQPQRGLQQLQQPHQYSRDGYRVTGSERTPSPQPQQGLPPTGQFTDDGRGVLFYVKALYDYTATIEEEFDFQAGDIIAVTATPEDGWWSGQLLDEVRRQPGRHVFPSNFVCLF